MQSGLMLLALGFTLNTPIEGSRTTMNDEPKLEHRKAQPYVAIRAKIAMRDLGAKLPPLWGEVATWLDNKRIKRSGPTLLRYVVVDMKNGLELEVGFPVANAVEGDDRVVGGALPSGRYVILVHRGDHRGLVGANAALQEWAKKRGLKWKMEGPVWSSRFELYPVDPGDTPDPTKWVTEIAYQVTAK